MDFYFKREEQEQAEEARRKREAEARAAQERHRREEESRQQADQHSTEELWRGQGVGQAQPSRQGSKRLVHLVVGGIALVVVFGATVGLAAVLLRGHYLPTTSSASKPTPSLPKAKSHPSRGSQNSSLERHEQAAKIASGQEQTAQTSLRSAIGDYYGAVERGDWNYTYEHLDSQTLQRFTRSEWIQKNQYFDYIDPLNSLTPKIVSEISTSSPAKVMVTRTFRSGITTVRPTYFVWKDGSWKHRFSQEEYDLYMANSSYDKFVQAWSQRSGSPTPTATATASAKQDTSAAAAETCEPSALAARQWEGWVAPSGPFGHPPCQNAEGTYRSYIPLGFGVTPMQNYLDAAKAGDYDTMYSLLAPADQQHYTLDEWRQANDAIGTDQSTYELADALVASDEQGATVGGQAIVKVTVPTDEKVTKYWWFESASEGEPWVHWLNDEEIKLLDEATSASGEQGPSYDQTAGSSVHEEAGVENAIRGHYQAIGAGDFAKAYSYFGPTSRSQFQNNEQGWIDSEESSQITGSTVNSLKVTTVSGDQATATVDVSFQDKSGTSRFLIAWQLVKEDGQWKLDKQVSGKRIS